MRSLKILAMGLVLAAAGCDMGDPGVHEREVVVEAWLIAGEPPPPVRLSWTQSVNTRYGNEPVAVEGATVTVRQLSDDGSAAETIAYFPGAELGVYVPASQPLSRIRAGGRYALTVLVPGQPLVTAETIIPGGFEILGGEGQTVEYQSTDQIEVNVTQSEYPGRDAVYIITMESLEPSLETLTPFLLDAIYGIASDEGFDPADLDPEDYQEIIARSSPPLNEANWEVNPDGSVRLKMPWFFVAFFGDNEVTVSAIDDNAWNFFRGVSAQEGNGGFSPGEIPNVSGGVSGGHGLFAGLARGSSRVNVQRASQ